MLAMLIPLTIGIAFSGCKKDEETCTPGNSTDLTAAIADAQQMHDDAVEGVNPGDYLLGAKAELQNAIDLATAVKDSECPSQTTLDNAQAALAAAVVAFDAKKITGVAPEALVAHWLFNGNGDDASGNGHNGVAEAGHIEWGGGMPEMATDRFGNENYCYKFVDGGNFVVPNSPAFRPNEMTISVWMNLYETWAHSYFISNDIWHTWKFQVQDANKPFFTAHFNKDDGSGEGWVDRDANTGILENDTWYQVVLTYTGGKMTFYINGEKVQEWDDFDAGTFIEPDAGVNLCIGQALPTGVYTDIEGDPHQWKDWLGYFKGYMDDMRFYNVMLTDAQIKSQYDYEKDNTITE